MKTLLNFRLTFFLFFLLLASTSSLQAQDHETKKEEYVILKMKDGSRIVGKKLATTPESIVVETQLAGKLNVYYKNIDRIKVVSSPFYTGGPFWKENPNYSRVILAPTGYGLQKGEGYYQNMMVFFNNVSYGFTDNFSVGFGTEFVSLINSLDLGTTFSPGFVLNPKFSFPVRKNEINIGVGGLMVHFPESDRFLDFGLLYSVSTFGSTDKNFSLGLGFGVVDGELASSPTIILGGAVRITNGLAFTSDNWIVPSEGITILTAGTRIIGERISWDVALLITIEGGFAFVSPIPLVGMVIPFGRD